MSKLSAKFILRALKSRNYRLFFIGQSVSSIGTWMHLIAASWLVYRLTQSAYMLGVLNLAAQAPIFFLSPFTGALGDRMSKHRIFLVSQILAMVQALILAGIVLSGNYSVWHIIILTISLGITYAFDIPMRHAIVPEIIEKREDLHNAVALSGLTLKLARLVGPGIAGILIALWGEAIVFLVNGLSYLAIIIALLYMKLKVEPVKRKIESKILEDLKEGFIYTFSQKAIRKILVVFFAVCFFSSAIGVLMPVLSKEILSGNASTYGFLMTGMGLGALIGVIFVASRKDTDDLTRAIFVTALLTGFGLMAFYFCRWFWLTYLVIAINGFAIMSNLSMSNSVIQSLAPDSKRGRVLGIYIMIFMGSIMFGGYLMGWLASLIQVPNTFFLAGLGCLLTLLFTGLKK